MAEIRKIARRPELSAFQQVAPTGGSATLLALAGTMQAAYERLRPAALKQMEDEASAEWTGQARRDMGNPAAAFTASTKGGSFRSALRQAESGGRSDVVNSEGFGGFYQWGPERLADYNRATGQNISFDQFLADADLQERAQDWHEGDILSQLGGYVGTTVNGQVLDDGALVGMANLGGVAGARKYIETGGAYNPADSNGTRLSDYAGRFGGLPVQNVTASSKGAPTVIQAADGSLQPRLYSPASGEFGQAYNAAASVVYRNEAELETSTALLDLSNQFTLDPDGFQQAAKAYIDETLKNVPDMFRGELRQVMQEQVQRRALGILEDRQTDIRQRAANSTQALIDRHSTALSEALVTGNPDAIAKAEADLRTQLAVKETLPGLSWTREQSENARADARDRAERSKATAQTAAKTEMERQLRTVRDAADAGLSSAFDAILQDPAAQAANPDLFADAQAAKIRQEAMPGFTAAPPADRAAMLADLRSNPVTDDRDVKTIQAFERTDKQVTAAFKKDPIAAAEAYLPVKPPALPDMSDPQAYGAALSARLAYGKQMQAQGYTDGVAVLSVAEREGAGALFGKGVPPEVKMIAAQTVVEAMGQDAGLFFEQADSDDRVSLMVGQMLAGGGSETVGLEAMRGQEMLDAGMVKKPTVPPLAAVSADVAAALSVLPGVPPTIMDTATAIYVARNQDLDAKSDAGKRAMTLAVQAALGQTTDPISRKTMGGVQTIGGVPTLLPPDMSGDDLSTALRGAVTRDMGALETTIRGIAGGSDAFDNPPEQAKAIWQAAGALSAPFRGNQPVGYRHKDQMFVRPVGNTGFYQLFVRSGNQDVPLHVEGSEAVPLLFKPADLIKATQ